MNRRVILPAALILDLDDMMWHDGRDLRHIGQASRSEFPRTHLPEDYTIVNDPYNTILAFYSNPADYQGQNIKIKALDKRNYLF